MIPPTISVILPVYNCEDYIYESAQSILEQTFEDFELLIINDGSTDKSKQIVLSLDDKRIRYREKDSGEYFSNTGIERAECQKLYGRHSAAERVTNQLQQRITVPAGDGGAGGYHHQRYILIGKVPDADKESDNGRIKK